MARKSETKFVIGAEDRTRAALQSVANRFKKTAKSMEALGKTMTRNITTPVAGAAVGLAGLAATAIRSGDQMAKLSTRLGISTRALSELKFVAGQSGVEFNTLTMGLQRMTRRVAEAAQGTGEAKAALAELGLSAMDLSRMSPDQQFYTLSDALSGVESSADKVRLAMKLFDSEGVALLQTMEGGSEAMRAQAEIANRLGVVIEDDMAKAAENAMNNLGELKASLVGIGITVADAVLPAVNVLIDKLQALMGWMRSLDRQTVMTTAGVAAFAAALGPIIVFVSKIQKTIGTVLPWISKFRVFMVASGATVAAWAAGIIAVLGVLFVVWANWGEDIKRAVGSAIDWLGNQWDNFLNWLPGAVDSGLQWVADAWQWLSDGIQSVMEPVLKWLGDAFNNTVSFIIKAVASVIGGIADVTGALAKWDPTGTLDGVTASLESAAQATFNFGEEFKATEFMGEQVGKLGDAIGGATTKAWEFVQGPLSEWIAKQPEILSGQWEDLKTTLLELIGLNGDLLAGGTGDTGDTGSTGSGAGVDTKGPWEVFQQNAMSAFENIKSAAEKSAGVLTDTFNGATSVISDGFAQLSTNMLGLTEGPIMIGKAFKQMAAQVIQNLVGIMAKMVVMWLLSKVLGFSVGKLPSPGAIFGGSLLPGGGKRLGGAVQGDRAYLVGEAGPELFVPRTNGSIVPNSQAQNMNMQPAVTANITINAEGNIMSDPLQLRRVAEVINREIEDHVKRTYWNPSAA